MSMTFDFFFRGCSQVVLDRQLRQCCLCKCIFCLVRLKCIVICQFHDLRLCFQNLSESQNTQWRFVSFHFIYFHNNSKQIYKVSLVDKPSCMTSTTEGIFFWGGGGGRKGGGERKGINSIFTCNAVWSRARKAHNRGTLALRYRCLTG